MLSHLAGRLASIVPRATEWWSSAERDTDMSDAQTHVGAPLDSLRVDAVEDASFHPSGSLPAELWGEIAQFSLRNDLMNLRSASTMLKDEADAAISTMTLVGCEALCAFTRAGCFPHLTSLRLVDVDDASLFDFARHMTAHPRHDLTLEIENSYQGVARGLAGLSGLPLATLRLHNVYLIDSIVHALQACRFPIELYRYFGKHEFMAAMRIPTLSTLISPSTEFDDAVAQAAASHPALQVLSIQACSELTSRGIADLARIPTLQALTVSEDCYLAHPINVDAARALAANPTLQRLSLVSRIQAPSEETFFRLSKSRTLRKLELVVCPGMQHLADMVALEHLTLCDSRSGHHVGIELARIVANMPNLHTLNLDGTPFATGALAILLAGCRAENIHLQRLALHREAVAALVANHHVKAVTLAHVHASVELLAPLFEIATIEGLTVDGQ